MSNDPFSEKAAENFLSGGGVAAKWPTVGYVVEGTVTGWRMDHQKDYETGEPLYWVAKRMVKESAASESDKADKNRVMQLIMDIDGEPTGETWEGLNNVRKALPDDDGARILYIKAALQAAFKVALRDAKGKLEEGAYVRVERIADGHQADKKKQAPHNYKVTWTPAAQNDKHKSAAESFLDGDTPAMVPDNAPKNPF